MVTNEAEKRRQVTLLDHIFLFKNVGKDATIPDQAALRNAVAQKVLEQVGSPSLAGSGVCKFPASNDFCWLRYLARSASPMRYPDLLLLLLLLLAARCCWLRDWIAQQKLGPSSR